MRRLITALALLLALSSAALAQLPPGGFLGPRCPGSGAFCQPLMPLPPPAGHGGIANNSTASYSGTATQAVVTGHKVIVGFIIRDATVSSYTAFTVSVTAPCVSSFTQDASAFFFDGTPREHGEYVYSGTSTSTGNCTVTVAITNGVSGKGGAIFVYDGGSVTSFTTSNSGNGPNNGAFTPSTSFTKTALLIAVGDFNDANTDIHCTLPGFTITVDNSTNTDFGSCAGFGSVVSSPTTYNMLDSGNLQWNILGAVYN